MNSPIERGQIGEKFEDFLQEEGRSSESTNQAVRRVITFQLTAAMKQQRLTKVAFAKKLQTSRSQLNRLLDPDDTNVTLESLLRATQQIGCKFNLELR